MRTCSGCHRRRDRRHARRSDRRSDRRHARRSDRRHARRVTTTPTLGTLVWALGLGPRLAQRYKTVCMLSLHSSWQRRPTPYLQHGPQRAPGQGRNNVADLLKLRANRLGCTITWVLVHGESGPRKAVVTLFLLRPRPQRRAPRMSVHTQPLGLHRRFFVPTLSWPRTK